MAYASFEEIPFLADYLKDADHVDVKSIHGAMSLREFVAGVFTYKPAWMQFLWKVRTWLVGVLGIKTGATPANETLSPDNLPIKSGETALFLTVGDSDGETFWAADCCENHLGFAVGIIADPVGGDGGARCFRIVTVVKYRNALGRVYFNIIRPFHHLVVVASMRSVLRNSL